MKIIKYYSDFNESYLKSNYAPLYHRTNVWYFESIIKDNKLKVGILVNKEIEVYEDGTRLY